MSTAAPVQAPSPAVASILDEIPQGVLVLDADGIVQAPQTQPASRLLRCARLVGTPLIELLKPLTGEKSLVRIETALSNWRAAMQSGDADPIVIEDLEVRPQEPDGAAGTAFYRIELHTPPLPDGARLALIADATASVQQARELADLRREAQVRGEILRGVLRLGRARFAASVQKTDAAMSAIDAILRKPAREQAAFRRKLEETLDQVDRIRREGAALKLSSLEGAARSFEDALHDLRGRPTLSGGDFLPLAVKLDDLYERFAMLRAATKSALPPARAPDAAPVTDNGTRIIDAPQFIRELRAAGLHASSPRRAAVGGLEKTLSTLAGHIAEEHAKKAALECTGLDGVPAEYQATVKNVAIQLIRNAIVHGIESAGRRARAGKPPAAHLGLAFKVLPDGGYELRFEDDGRGVDPQLVRRTASAKGLLSPEDAAALSDRQAIKLIFKAGFTTLPQAPGGPAHGAGLTLVRRYVDEAGGTIALASEPGRNTRYKISLPRIVPPAA